MSPRIWRRTMRTAVARLTEGTPGHAVSQRKRKRVEEVFGWMKTMALQRKTRFLGPERTGWMFTLARRSVQPREDTQSSGSYRIWTSVSKGRKHSFGHRKTS